MQLSIDYPVKLADPSKIKVLIACEESQASTIEFRKRGFDAYSCDIQDCSGEHPEWHIKGDAIEQAYSGKYDLMIAHPPCTYLTNSGVRWLNIVDGRITNKERLQEMLWASQFFKSLLEAPINLIGVENPIPHKYAALPDYDQLIQPYHFGHPESKATCFWLKGLPKLRHTNDVKQEWESLPISESQKIFYMSPGPERTKLRSKTYKGIAEAIADQWGCRAMEYYGHRKIDCP